MNCIFVPLVVALLCVTERTRDAEQQADLMGTQILFDSGYDPRAMAQFFQNLEAESGARGPAARTRSDSPEFQRVKRILRSK